MKTTTLIVNIIFILLFIPSIVTAFITWLTSQAPNSEVSTSSPFFILLTIFPFVILTCQIISWIFFANGIYKFALWVGLAPVINLLLVIIYFK